MPKRASPFEQFPASSVTFLFLLLHLFASREWVLLFCFARFFRLFVRNLGRLFVRNLRRLLLRILTGQ